jgi:curved DNA-binding protein CbpA
MQLSPPVTMVELKAQYKSLVKIHHPDANGGDRDAEERLKLINDAYTTLKAFLG